MFKGKKYAKSLEVWGDWYDASFIDLILQAIEENELSGKFYLLDVGDDGFGYIFLSPSQYQYLKENGLMQFDE